MSSEEISIIIDFSILFYNKFLSYVMKNNFRTDLTVLKMSAFVVANHSLSDYSNAIKNFNPSGTFLESEERLLILLLFGASLHGQNGINIWHGVCFLHRSPYKAIKALSSILKPDSSFVRSGLIMFAETDFLSTGLSIEDMSEFYNNRRIFLSPFALNSIFSNFTGSVPFSSTNFHIANRYVNVDMLLGDVTNVIKYIFFLSNFYRMNSAYSSLSENIYEKGEFSKNISLFLRKISTSKLKIPLVNYVKTHKFSNIEFVVFLFLIYKVAISKEFFINSIEEVLTNFAFIPSQIKGILSCFSKESVFVTEEFIGQADFYGGYPVEEDQDEFEDNSKNPVSGENSEFSGIPSDFNAISISKEKIYYLLFSDSEYQGKLVKNKLDSGENNAVQEIPGDPGKNKGLYEILTPHIKINNVILDESVKMELLGAVDLTRAAETMKKWGVKPNLTSSTFGAIKILLYGASGTGKTITAQALAGEAGADLFKVDASNLVSSWVGESTKNVKRVFKEFHKYTHHSRRRVFLFMNEADQLLSSRGVIQQAADKEYNQMQNLLLEELENFDGVFLATTNLLELFDSAWNRRFNIKIKFDIPKYETRLKLWKVHISESMPLAEDVDFKKLATYELAGGSIANVVYNAARKAALKENENKSVTQQDFIEAINNELKTHIGARTSRVGFSQ